MTSLRVCFSCLLPLSLGAATPPIEKPAKKESSSEWVFSLLPKSLQKNPHLELTVITEMTELGRQFPPTSSQSPAYVHLYSNGPRHMGHAEGAGKTLKQETVEELLARALAPNGFLPARPPEHPPSILIVYTWGSHNLLAEGDAENPALSGQQVARNLLDRAALVGGDKFARQLLELFEQPTR